MIFTKLCGGTQIRTSLLTGGRIELGRPTFVDKSHHCTELPERRNPEEPIKQ